MKKLRLAAVKYMNTLPMLHGLQISENEHAFDMTLEHPSECARMLVEGDVDIALCPVGALIDLDEYHIVSGYGIGCKGSVRTVAIYSDCPLEELKVIKLYGASRSSNILAQVLDRYFWKLNLKFVNPDQVISDLPVGQLVIGDACFKCETKYQHMTDLGDEWFKFTGLPFLFACWVSLKPIDANICKLLDESFAAGIADLDHIHLPRSQEYVDLRQYLLENIQYQIDEETLKGVKKFVDYVDEMSLSLTNAVQTPSGQSI